MLIIPIEKEIEADHRIMGRFNIRELVCLAGIIAAVLVFYFVIGDVFWTVLCSLPFVVIFGSIGWYTKNGLMMEDFLLKRIQVWFYKNDSRRYRTKNRYFALFRGAGIKEKSRQGKDNRKKGKKRNG